MSGEFSLLHPGSTITSRTPGADINGFVHPGILLNKCTSEAIEYSEDVTHNEIVASSDATVGTTTFTGDGPGKSSQAVLPSKFRRGTLDHDWSKVSIEDFLKTPYALKSDVISPGAGRRIHTTTSPGTVMHYNNLLKERLKGFLGFRATTVIRLVINADKHTQGRLALCWIPTGPINDVGNPDTYLDHQRYTQLPHVQMDVNSEAECELRIPYRGPSTHYNLRDGRGAFGNVFLSELLPVQGGSPNYTMYIHFEDIDLVTPTVISGAVTQSGLQAEQDNSKPISSRLSAIATVSSSLASVPVLSSVAYPVSWASGLMAGVASAFGYSKPLNTKSAEVRVSKRMPGTHLYDGVDWGESLGLTANPGVPVDPDLSLTEQDELSFKFLTQIRSSIDTFSWDITGVNGDKIFSMPLSPPAMTRLSKHYLPNGAVVAHPIFYVAQCFGMYRGSFDVTLTLSKTLFHTGRLMVVFEPGSDNRDDFPGNTYITSMDQVQPCHKDIIDIRSSHTFTLTFPFTATTPYLPMNKPYGFLHVFVVNPLVRNVTNVTSNIDVLVSVNGRDDWDFAGPVEPKYWPFRPHNSQPDAHRHEDNFLTDGAGTWSSPLVQSGLEVDSVKISEKPVGSCSLPSETHQPAIFCAGEKIQSLKQIAMRSKLVTFGSANSSPDVFGVDAIFSTAAGFERNVKPYRDWYSYVGALYAYNRGGVMLTVHRNETAVMPVRVGLVHRLSYTRNGPGVMVNHGDMMNCGFVAPGECGRFYIPPYLTGYCRHRYDSTSVVVGKPTQYDPGVSRVKVFVMEHDSTDFPAAGGVKVYRSAAEDTQFGYFTGVPLLVSHSRSDGAYYTGGVNHTA